MGTATSRLSNPVPADYKTPPFPALSWPIGPKKGDPESHRLYYTTDIWRFTIIWTLIVYGAFHIAASGYAVVMQTRRNWLVWLVPVLYALVGGVEATMAGSIVGLILGAVYNAGYFHMSTWIPFVWSLICVLVLILSSFSIQGGL